MKDVSSISLSSYAARMNIQLLKAAAFNGKLRERGCPSSVTVQKICKISILAKVAEQNRGLYELERMLEETKD